MMSRRPAAPALAQGDASSLIFTTRSCVEGRAPSKTQLLRCFRIIQGVNKAMEARPLRMDCGVPCLAVCHQSRREGSWLGGVHGKLSQAMMSCQTFLEKGHWRSRWSIVLGSWQHRRQGSWWCCSPRRAKRSAVQHRSWSASQWKKRARDGAQLFHMILQDSLWIDPWKVAL